MDNHNGRLLDMTVGIVTHYVAHNPLPPEAVAVLIVVTHGALNRIHAAPDPEPIEKPTPAGIRRSIQEKGLVSFVDGRTYQSLKRHLTVLGLTPDEYRGRYGLPADYPMVSPVYSARRSVLAKNMGLGKTPRTQRKPGPRKG